MTVISRSWPVDPAGQGHLHGRSDPIALTVGLIVVIWPWAAPILDVLAGEPADRPVRAGRHGRPADDHSHGLHRGLHGAEGHRADEPADRAGSGRAVGSLLSVVPRSQGADEGGLHARRGPIRLVFTWAPVVTYLASVMTLLVIPFGLGLLRPGLEHRAALLLRHRRAVRRRSADGRLGELRQVLAARRAASAAQAIATRSRSRCRSSG